jgi:hypothetical protein
MERGISSVGHLCHDFDISYCPNIRGIMLSSDHIPKRNLAENIIRGRVLATSYLAD